MLNVSRRRLAKLKRELAVDAPVIGGSDEHLALQAADRITGRIVIKPDEPTPSEPIL